MRDIVHILKALSDEYRLRIVKILERKDLCVCELQELLGLSQPAVSHHLKVLSNAGIIDYVKDGLFVNYRLKKGVDQEVERMKKMLLQALEETEMVKVDLGKLEGVDREKILGSVR